MCGIAGLISSDGPAEATVGQMIGRLVHRGPDDQGIWGDEYGQVCLAHRRLSIVDLSAAGHQPMLSANGQYVLTFNGEIYNHGDLRKQLEEEGLALEGGWCGHSDTEVFLECISHWGLKPTLERSVGMFAFALWDRRARRLHLARDRFGEKPLYYGWLGHNFVFGSELKALNAHPRFTGSIDRYALGVYAARGYIPAPLSIYERVYKLPPACILTVTESAALRPMARPPQENEDNGDIRLDRYWSYRAVAQHGLRNPITDEREGIEELERRLALAVREQSMADVPVGAFLSGGIDSSTICALYQKYSSIPVRTFSIGFQEDRFNEAHHAKAVARELGTIHRERYVTVAEASAVIPLLPEIYDEPFADSSQIPTYLVSQFAREHVTVALTGDGGDELFGGYRRHSLGPVIWSYANKMPRPVRAPLARALSSIPSPFWTRVAHLAGKRGDHWGGVIQDAFLAAGLSRTFEDLYCSYLNEWAFETSPVLQSGGDRQEFLMHLGADAPNSVRGMYSDAMSYLPDDILCKVDRASMAVALETRVPFLDHRVAEFAARIPITMKVRGREGKIILRKVLGRELSPELFERPKTGFSVPIGDWLKGPLRAWAEDLLDPGRLAEGGWFDAHIVRRRWEDHLSGRRDSTPALWSVLVFEMWLRSQRRTTAMAA
jgi:asparagine synthase (glutamine-hydrolysing)